MSSVFTPPVSLQDLLGTKAGGRNPDELVRAISPSIEMLKMLAAGRGLVFTAATVTPTAVGYWPAGTLTVPQGQLWLVFGLGGIGVATGVGDTFSFAVASSGDAVHPWAGGAVANAAQSSATRGQSYLFSGMDPFILPAGASLGAYVHAAAVVTNSRVDLSALYCPLFV